MNSLRTRPRLLVVFCLGVTAHWLIGQSSEARMAVASEGALRRNATNSPTPVFPESSRKTVAKGVAVAKIKIGPEGTVTEVTVLEAPDAAIEMAVLNAVRAWRFPKDLVRSVPATISGRLTFYFLNDKGQALVRGPLKLPRATPVVSRR